MSYAEKRSAAKSHPCHTDKSLRPADNQATRISLVEMSGAFIIYGIGMSLAALAMALESLYWRMSTNTS